MRITGYCFYNADKICVAIAQDENNVLLVPILRMQKSSKYDTSCVFYPDDLIGNHKINHHSCASYQYAQECTLSQLNLKFKYCGEISKDTLHKLQQGAICSDNLAEDFLKYFPSEA